MSGMNMFCMYQKSASNSYRNNWENIFNKPFWVVYEDIDNRYSIISVTKFGKWLKDTNDNFLDETKIKYTSESYDDAVQFVNQIYSEKAGD